MRAVVSFHTVKLEHAQSRFIRELGGLETQLRIAHREHALAGGLRACQRGLPQLNRLSQGSPDRSWRYTGGIIAKVAAPVSAL
jgi:hypothetical protein